VPAGTIPVMETPDTTTVAATGDAAGAGPAPAGADVEPPADIDGIEHLLDEVGHTLARLDDGTYGRCEACGGAVEPALLAERPTARLCGACPPPPTEA